jgi:Tol biopolymer transport system component
MTPERWQQLKQIFQAALEQNPAERSAFLTQACAGDPSLRREVESLISSHDQAGSSIEAMAAEAATEMLANDHAIVGKQIGHYQVLSSIGRGGMGEVFLAQDTRLGRKVALKLLRSDLTSNEERLRRFRQEAQAASALNHPNILTIHEIGQAGPLQYIATEYVEGETLRESISRARMTLGQTLDVAIQVAGALAAAHNAGIIHRDIKPENIMLRTDGYVKVLDFGLAKLIEPGTVHSVAPTLVKVETAPGVVMGTFSYMSPEQARGLAVDARTDIWSLGVMIYEMAAGRQPFEGETASDVLSLILQKEPQPLVHSWPEVPGELERIVRKALRKDKEERYQTIKDLLIDLRALRKELELEAEIERSAPPLGARPVTNNQFAAATARYPSSAEYIVTEIKHHKRAAVLILIAVIVSAIVLLYVLSRRNPVAKEAPKINATFTQLSDQAGPELFPSLSPDGKSFVYASYASGNWDIHLQRVGGKNPVNLTKDSTLDDTQPAFSPDGERIAFRSEREGGGIFVMGATGESVKRLTDFGFNPAWSPDGKEIACADEGPVDPAVRSNPNSRVWAVNVATGERRQVTKEDSIQPNWSPHGNRIAYGGRRDRTQRDIWTIPAGGGEPTEVTNDSAVEGSPVWSPDGKYLYFASDRAGSMNLWRVAIEEQTGRVLGPAEPVTTPSPYSAQLSFSVDGRRMVYSQILSRGNLQQVGFDPEKETVTGQPVWITKGSLWANTPHLSPDGEWLAFDSQGGKQEDLFVIRRDGTSLRQLTDDLYKDRQPRWSPDGKRIAFFSDRSGKWEVWMINSDASGLRQVTSTPGGATNPQWSPDGTRLSYRSLASGPSIIEVDKPWAEQSPQVLPSMTDSTDWRAWSWSPDGRKLAGNKFPASAAASTLVYSLETQHYEKLTDFGRSPVWLSDSRRLLFIHQGKLYLVDSQSRKVRDLLSLAPNEFGFGVTISRDDRQIYFSLVTTEADIWLMKLE